jgi:hypothetical protein
VTVSGYPIWVAMMEDARERGEVRYHHPTYWRGYETPPYYEPVDVALASACACGGSLHTRCAVPVLGERDRLLDAAALLDAQVRTTPEKADLNDAQEGTP